MTQDSIDPPIRFDDNVRVIRKRGFFDTPRDDSEIEKDVPYVPSETEWKDLLGSVRFLSFTCGFGIGLGALGLILAIVAFATKLKT